MARTTSRRFTYAKDESQPVPLRERIGWYIRPHFKDIGKPRRVFKRVKPYEPVPGRREELARQAELAFVKNQLEHEAYAKEQHRRKLIERISSPPPPLIDRIEPAVEPAPYEFKETPKNLHFRTNAQVSRDRDFNRKFAGTEKHIGPLFERVQTHGYLLKPEVRDRLVEYSTRFYHLKEQLNRIVNLKEFSTAEWKKVDKDLKRAGEHKLKELKPRFVEHCEELVKELGPDWLKVVRK